MSQLIDPKRIKFRLEIADAVEHAADSGVTVDVICSDLLYCAVSTYQLLLLRFKPDITLYEQLEDWDVMASNIRNEIRDGLFASLRP